MNEEQKQWFEKVKQLVNEHDTTSHADPGDYENFVGKLQDLIDESPEP